MFWFTILLTDIKIYMFWGLCMFQWRFKIFPPFSIVWLLSELWSQLCFSVCFCYLTWTTEHDFVSVFLCLWGMRVSILLIRCLFGYRLFAENTIVKYFAENTVAKYFFKGKILFTLFMLWLVHEQCHGTSQKTQTRLQRRPRTLDLQDSKILFFLS